MNKCIISILLLASSQLANAGSITDTYTPGDTLTAEKMNNVKVAVNDNDTNIATKQNLITGTCVVGQYIREIKSDGTVTCEVDADTDTDTTYYPGSGLELVGTTFSISEKTHYLTVPSVAFRPYSSDTTFTGDGENPFMSVTGGEIATIAVVNVPHGATITGLSMRAWDASPASFVTIDLRKFTGGPRTSSISAISTTAQENQGYYVKSDDTISEEVDLSTSNHNFYYLLQTLPTAGTSAGPTVYAARITYTY